MSAPRPLFIALVVSAIAGALVPAPAIAQRATRTSAVSSAGATPRFNPAPANRLLQEPGLPPVFVPPTKVTTIS